MNTFHYYIVLYLIYCSSKKRLISIKKILFVFLSVSNSTYLIDFSNLLRFILFFNSKIYINIFFSFLLK